MGPKQELYELTLGTWNMKRLYDYSGPMGKIFDKKDIRQERMQI